MTKFEDSLYERLRLPDYAMSYLKQAREYGNEEWQCAIKEVSMAIDHTNMDEPRPVLFQIAFGEHCLGQATDHQERHFEYCARHGYEHVILEIGIPDQDPTCYWHKIPLIIDELKKRPYVFYMDTDCVVIDLDKPMHKAIPEWAWMSLTVHPEPSNFDVVHFSAGVMLIRSCAESIAFFERIWEKRHQHSSSRSWHQQQAMNELIVFDPQWQKGIFILPFSWNNSPHNQPHYDPIIAAWHGWGNQPERRGAMNAFVKDRPFR